MSYYKEIPIEDLVPTADNPRTVRDDDERHRTLTESIKSVGVLQPVLARPHPTKKGKFDLRAGVRRLRAAKAAGKKSVPAIVHDWTDAEAVEATVVENLEREDLHPIEEARGIQSLLDAGWDRERIASRFGRSEKWIARRTQLGQLIGDLAELAVDPDHRLGRAPVGVLERLAALPAPVQREIFDDEAAAGVGDEGVYSAAWNWAETAAAADEHLAELLRSLHGAPWKMDDEVLYPEAGACSTCPKRSGHQPLLWDDLGTPRVAKRDRCLDARCYTEKSTRSIKVRIAALRAKHGKVVLCGTGRYGDDADKRLGEKVVGPYAHDPCKKTDPGALLALVVSGPSLGKTKWVQPRRPQLGTSSGPSRPTADDDKLLPLEERRAKLADRRKAIVVDAVREQLDRWGRAEPDDFNVADTVIAAFDEALLRFVAVFGSDPATGGGVPSPDPAWGSTLEWRVADNLSKDPYQASALVWQSLLCTWADRLTRHPDAPIDELLAVAERVCVYVTLDFAALQAKAEAAVPEPKSWANLKADGTPKTLAAKAGKKQAGAAAEKPQAAKAKAKGEKRRTDKAARAAKVAAQDRALIAGEPLPDPDVGAARKAFADAMTKTPGDGP